MIALCLFGYLRCLPEGESCEGLLLEPGLGREILDHALGGALRCAVDLVSVARVSIRG